MLIEDIHLIPGIRVLINFCSERLYCLTYVCVCRAVSEVVGRTKGKIQYTYRNEEIWLFWVKEDHLDRSLDLFERGLRVSFGDLVYPNATITS
jgi:hypothetical protein